MEEDTFHNRLDWNLWRRVFAHALPYKKQLIILAVAAILLAICDGSFALITRWAIDDMTQAEARLNPWPYVGAYIGLAAVLGVGVAVFIQMAGFLSNQMSYDIRRDAFARVQALEFAYFDHRPTGWLISRLTSDCDKLARIIAWGLLDLLWATCLVLAIGTILLILNWQLGLLVLATVPVLVVLSSWFQKQLLLSSRQTRKVNSFITASFSESLQGLKTTRTLVREDDNLAEFSRLSTDMYQWSVRNAVQSAVYLPLVLTIGSIAAGVVLWVGGLQHLGGALTLGTLVAFIFYSGQFFDPINQIASVLVQLQSAQAAGERVLSLLATQPQIIDSPDVKARIATARPQAGLAPDGLPDAIQQIEFRNVHFAYADNQPVVSDFNLLVLSGQTIALVGESGGGKSTLISLLARFYEPTSGGIFLDGIEYRQRSIQWYQSQLGIVLQTPHLFNGTIAENIRYGRLDASDQEIEIAARMVNAHAFIKHLDHGYATAVGEGGNRLSTGQKQLISFARAILANPRIFIMDEATASIDTETEALIQSGMANLLKGRISFVIAHRLSTIRAADTILVIDKGRIREVGTHQQLVAQRGHYHALLHRQFAAPPQ